MQLEEHFIKNTMIKSKKIAIDNLLEEEIEKIKKRYLEKQDREKISMRIEKDFINKSRPRDFTLITLLEFLYSKGELAWINSICEKIVASDIGEFLNSYAYYFWAIYFAVEKDKKQAKSKLINARNKGYINVSKEGIDERLIDLLGEETVYEILDLKK